MHLIVKVIAAIEAEGNALPAKSIFLWSSKLNYMKDTFMKQIIAIIGESYFKEPVHFQKLPSFASLNHMIQMSHLLFANPVNLFMILDVVVCTHLF